MKVEYLCDSCHQPQTEPGALLFSPPQWPVVCRKWHICESCYNKISWEFLEVQRLIHEECGVTKKFTRGELLKMLHESFVALENITGKELGNEMSKDPNAKMILKTLDILYDEATIKPKPPASPT